MHEANFTEEIVQAIIGELDKYPDLTPSGVRIKVGEMLHLVPESVRLHYELITRGTRLEGARLDLVEEPVRVKCQNCGESGGVEDHHLLICSKCSSRQVQLVDGNSVIIESIDFDESSR